MSNGMHRAAVHLVFGWPLLLRIDLCFYNLLNLKRTCAGMTAHPCACGGARRPHVTGSKAYIVSYYVYICGNVRTDYCIQITVRHRSQACQCALQHSYVSGFRFAIYTECIEL